MLGAKLSRLEPTRSSVSICIESWELFIEFLIEFHVSSFGFRYHLLTSTRSHSGLLTYLAQGPNCTLGSGIGAAGVAAVWPTGRARTSRPALEVGTARRSGST